jgi:hypothetical protein
MGGGTWAQSSYMPRTQAERFFDANIKTDAYGSNSINRSFSESAGKVTGNASAVLPMTLMRIFGRETSTLTVTCETEMRLPNTDVMFVLDVTGSMNCVAGDKSCTNNGERPAFNSKIDGLKVAVKCFYEIVARLDSNANCEGGAPSGGTGNQVQIRFGFVPYASNVNVGRLLPTNFVIDQGEYNSREFVPAQLFSTNTTKVTVVGRCPTYTDTDTTKYSVRELENYGNIFRVCEVVTSTFTPPQWRYGKVTLDVSGLKNGSQWNRNFTAKIGDLGLDAQINWPGCIEERATVQRTSYDPIPAGARDLDIDATPVAGNPETQWRPSLPDATYLRRSFGNRSDLNRDITLQPITTNYSRFGQPTWSNYYCPTESKRMQTWPIASQFDAYVDSLVATGNTYHDIGMIWGARLISPTGIFRADNEYTPQGGEIERHLIFMTDGDATSAPCDYNAYGIPFFDRLQTTDVGNASDCSTQRTSLANQINARMSAVCTAIKNKNITLWVVSFGGDTVQATEDRLEACASEGRYFQASDSAALQRTFRSIADQISALRIVK